MNKYISRSVKLLKGEFPFGYLLYKILCRNKISSYSASLIRKWDIRHLPTLPEHIKVVSIKTYDGLNQTVHPDVVISYLQKPEEYIMTITPFPYGDDKYENPCLYISQNGVDWQIPEGIQNPLALPESFGHNYLSDSEIICTKGFYWLYYRECIQRSNTNVDRIYRLESEDLINWSIPKLLFEVPFCEVISPTIIEYKRAYHIYYVCFEKGNPSLVRSVSCDGGFDNKEVIPVAGIPQGMMLWHIDVVADGELLRGLFTLSTGAEGQDSDLYYAESNDGGNHWIIKNKAFICKDQYEYFKAIYRSSMVKKNNGNWNLYFSALTINNSWHTFVIQDYNPDMNAYWGKENNLE